MPKLPEDGYLPRAVDETLRRALRGSGAVYIMGPKWRGKTATEEHQSKSQVYLQDPDRRATLLALIEAKPSLILEGEEPRLIDEWQEAPQLWDAVRFAVDQGRGRGRFILTGSATPRVRPAHSGVGQIAPLRMRTMSPRVPGVHRGDIPCRALGGQADVTLSRWRNLTSRTLPMRCVAEDARGGP